jgi:hypothetical protein
MANDLEYVAKQKETRRRKYEAHKLRMATDPVYAERERARTKLKPYNKEKARVYYEANKERLRAQGREWHANNPEYAKAYYEKNKERLNQITKEWIKANPERHKANRKAYETANKEAIREKARAWAKREYEQNRDKVVARRRAIKQRQFEKDPVGFVTKRNDILRRSAKRKVDMLKDEYVAHLLGKSTGIKLKASDIPQELIEAKRLHVLIKRELRDAHQRP